MSNSRNDELEKLKEKAREHAKTLDIDLENITNDIIDTKLREKINVRIIEVEKAKQLEDAAAALKQFIIDKAKLLEPKEEEQKPHHQPNVPNNETVYEVILKNPNDMNKVKEQYTKYVEDLKGKNALQDDDLKRYQAITKKIPERIENGKKIEAHQVVILRFKSEEDAMKFIKELEKKCPGMTWKKISPSQQPTPQAESEEKPDAPRGPGLR